MLITDFKNILKGSTVLQIPKIYECKRQWQKKASNHEQHKYLSINYIIEILIVWLLSIFISWVIAECL